MHLDPMTLGVVAILAALAFASARRQMRRVRSTRAALDRARTLGLDQPVSLHPVIDPNLCIGCGGCVVACPEGDVLGLVGGRAQLVNAAHCVGHGLCQKACPQDAITLVFGTATRGMQIPEVAGDYQSNVPGLYIAGELGGMGLIRNAVTQGVHAARHAARGLGGAQAGWDTDIAIVGAGPAGLAAALACRERDVRHVLFDQDGLGGSVNHYPRRKLVMTTPVDLPVVGRMPFKEVGKEELLEFWTNVVAATRLPLRAPERVLSVDRLEGGFRVVTERGAVTARRVILAVGRRGTPRKLGVPGESGSSVAYRLLEPERWSGRPVVVVGGGNSAVEAAAALAEAGARTWLSYRGAAFARLAAANQERLRAAEQSGLEVLLESQVTEIAPQRTVLETPAGRRVVDAEQVFVLIGGELPSQFLDKIGVRMHWHHGERPAAAAQPAGSRP
jgi:thioredoxin reductase/Pyruvate/2-oxoacid:ferredoxin oxidoreductase delta subunit